MLPKKAGLKKNQPLSTEPTKPESTTAVFAAVLAICIVLTILLFGWLYHKNSLNRNTVSQLAELRLLTAQISVGFYAALQGDEQGFSDLQKAQQQFNAGWQYFLEGKPATPEAENLNALWTKVLSQSQQIVNKAKVVISFRKQSEGVQSTLLKVKKNSQVLVGYMATVGGARSNSERQFFLTEHLLLQWDSLLNGQSNLVEKPEVFQRDFQNLMSVLTDQLQSGVLASDAEKLQLLKENIKLIENLQTRWVLLAPIVAEVLKFKELGRDLPANTRLLLSGLTELMQESQSVNPALIVLCLLLVAASVITLVLMLRQSNLQTQSLLKAEASMRFEEEQANKRNQKAILRLLDELGDLADGDLTVETTVTEDFTGAIADSINFTIDQLRSLVSTINQTAVQVSSAAQATQDTATALADASDHQAQEIAGASAAITEMALSIDQVSANAYESSAVAERSVNIAKKGADVVQATIRGMDTIREQIQDTSKRMKRLGESSQEIGDIVSLINDIADQTNILALNAAIQASMAGDAGRGFAVVADEVQRLAERASAATKQIESLVKTIQNDTHEAVISMEQTTTQVVNGANLAQDAGVALEEIENVSSNLAKLIQNISNAARQQAASAGQISSTMNVIQQITSQTSAGTSVTANSIGHLADLAIQMRTSVSGFKLPDQNRVV